MKQARRISVRAEQASMPIRQRVRAVLGGSATGSGTTAAALPPPPAARLLAPAPAAAPPSIVPVKRQQQQQWNQQQSGQQQASGAAAAPAASTAVQDALCSPQATAAAAAAFGAIAWAVFCCPDHPIHAADAAAHAAVRGATSAAWRLDVAELIISNGPIAAGLAAWAAASVAALAAGGPRRAAAPLAAAGAFNLLMAGPGGPGLPDPCLVDALKHAFARVRPSVEIHTTYAFPSGHTTAAAFTVGAALLVLLPLAARLVAGRRQGSGSGSSSSGGRLPDAVVLPVWAVAIATTASGRVLADAHWVSDTMAGAALGIGCVSALAQVFAFVERAPQPAGPGESPGGDPAAAAPGATACQADARR